MTERFYPFEIHPDLWRICDKLHCERFIWCRGDGEPPILFHTERTARTEAARLNALNSDAKTPWLD